MNRFNKGTSVFARWHEPEDILVKAFEQDIKYMKLEKFIKDKKDRQQTIQVLKNNYEFLKNQFINLICNPQTYPTIGWTKFLDCCQHWKIMGSDLSQVDLKIAFISVNFE